MATEAYKAAPAVIKTPVTLPDEGEWGPAMRALGSDRQRRFVYAFVMDGGRNYQRAYLEAGFSPGTVNAATVNAWKLAHDERIQAAIREESYKRLGRTGAAAADFLASVVENPDMKTAMRMKASLEILNRIGIHAMTEHKVTVEKKMNPQEKIDHAMRLAQALGLDPAKLLGAAGVQALPAPVSDTSEPNASIERASGPSETIEDAVVVETLDDWTAA